MSRLTIILLLLAATTAQAAMTIPPPPDWWQVPPDGRTRLQHHSFHADPNLNLPPDATYDGFVPAQPDQWTLPTGIMYNQPNPTPWAFIWQGIGGQLNDNVGATLPGPGTLTKRMGNLEDDRLVKEFYALIIWSGAPGTLTMNVNSPGSTVTATTYEMGEAGMLASVIEGTIDPQPMWEDFTFTFNTGVFIDEVYIGTHCIPEPAALCLLLAGTALCVVRRR
jgi:hypothetical protein